jgi:hypothetical protein
MPSHTIAGSYFRELRNNFWVKKNLNQGSGIEKIRIRDGKNLDPGWKKFGSGMEKIWIQNGKNLDPG